MRLSTENGRAGAQQCRFSLGSSFLFSLLTVGVSKVMFYPSKRAKLSTPQSDSTF